MEADGVIQRVVHPRSSAQQPGFFAFVIDILPHQPRNLTMALMSRFSENQASGLPCFADGNIHHRAPNRRPESPDWGQHPKQRVDRAIARRLSH